MSRTPRRRAWAAALAVLFITGLVVVFRVGVRPPEKDTDARIEFYRARLGGPGTYPAYARLGLAYLQKAREAGQARYIREAEEHLRRSLGFQRNYDAIRGMAAVHLARHEFREALAYAQEAVATLPGDLEARGVLFDTYLALGDEVRAGETADAMMKLLPSFASYARMAALLEYRGDYPAALRMMGQACKEAEAEQVQAEAAAWCQVRVGSIYVALCDAAQAESHYRRALERLPGYFFAREHLAELRATQGRAGEAIEIYEKLLAESPNPHYRIALAGAYEAAGQPEKASRELETAREELRRSAASGSRDEWRALALLLVRSPATAEEGLRWAQRDAQNRNDVLTLDTLAWAYDRNNQPEMAWKILEPAVRAGTREPVVLLHAASIRLRLSDAARARALLEQAQACPLRLSPTDRKVADKTGALLR
jgi:tetratricopeptide (TPR) repeat protein